MIRDESGAQEPTVQDPRDKELAVTNRAAGQRTVQLGELGAIRADAVKSSRRPVMSQLGQEHDSLGVRSPPPGNGRMMEVRVTRPVREHAKKSAAIQVSDAGAIRRPSEVARVSGRPVQLDTPDTVRLHAKELTCVVCVTV